MARKKKGNKFFKSLQKMGKQFNRSSVGRFGKKEGKRALRAATGVAKGHLKRLGDQAVASIASYA